MKTKKLVLPTLEYVDRTWHLRFEKVRGLWGECDRQNRIIRVDPTACLAMQAAIVLHEADHMLHIDDEERAIAAERTQMMLLHALGVFKEEEDL